MYKWYITSFVCVPFEHYQKWVFQWCDWHAGKKTWIKLNKIDFKTVFIFSTNFQGIFPNLKVVKLLLDCDADVNAKNESKSTALHVASNPYNYVGEVCFLKYSFSFSKKYQSNTNLIQPGCSSVIGLWSSFGSTKPCWRTSTLSHRF